VKKKKTSLGVSQDHENRRVVYSLLVVQTPSPTLCAKPRVVKIARRKGLYGSYIGVLIANKKELKVMQLVESIGQKFFCSALVNAYAKDQQVIAALYSAVMLVFVGVLLPARIFRTISPCDVRSECHPIFDRRGAVEAEIGAEGVLASVDFHNGANPRHCIEVWELIAEVDIEYFQFISRLLKRFLGQVIEICGQDYIDSQQLRQGG
jgi:hypothetical protein